jgi:Predicted 3'-5' exonuclease related to the exonuclease domain of PolB
MDGSQVEALARAGEFDRIAAYCLGDMIVTFRLMLRFALIPGEIDDAQAEASEESLEARAIADTPSAVASLWQ